MDMDSGLGSDEDRRSRTKEQKQRLNQQLLSGCFIDAASLADDGEILDQRRNDERRQGALIFQTSIPQFSMLQMSGQETRSYTSLSASCTSIPMSYPEPNTPYNSIVQLDAERVDSGRKTPLGFYVDLNDVSEAPPTAPPSTSAKKNIFSMVIDFEAPKKDMPSRLSSSLCSRRRDKLEHKSKRLINNKKREDTDSDCGSSSTSQCRSEDIGKCSDNNEEICDSKSVGNNVCNEKDFNIHNYCNESSSSSSECVHLNDDGTHESLPEKEADQVTSESDQICENNLQQEPTTENPIDHTSSNENVNIEKENIEKMENKTESNVNNEQKFVKLSDLEHQAPRVDYSFAPKMSKSIPESSWVESPLLMSRSAGYRSAPHPMEPETSELSDTGSITDTSTSQPRRSAQRLGTDLLRMFLEEIGPDVVVEVDGHRLKAHKCILASRCQYFAAMLSGNWLEDSGNIISLQGFSYESVYFALCHIYSGAAHVPDSISLVELASLADMLGLEGLKEVVEHALKQRHCHNFHKPCAGCCTGVVEVLPLAAAYGLDDLYQKCLHWITQHFVRVWPSRAFAGLPRELRDKCYQQHIVHMCPDSVLETTVSCDKLLATVPALRWSECIVQLALQLADACQLYIRQHFVALLASTSFTALDSRLGWNISQVEECLLSASGNLSPDQACRSYARCHKLLEQIWTPCFTELLHKIKKQVEQCIVGQAEKASRSGAWQRLDPALRARIKELSCLPLDEPVTRLPRATANRNKKYVQTRSTKQQFQSTVSSSDSSRNSSPHMNQTHSRLNVSTGSPSLRRSLLLAARAPQIPPSPSAHRRSTLTQPTQSSAAKTAPTRNIKPSQSRVSSVKPAPNKNLTSRENIKNTPAKVINQSTNRNKVSKETITNRPTNKKPTVSQIRSGANIKREATPAQKKSESRVNSPKKATAQVKDNTKCKPAATVQRSSTFLKEEPTVLGKVQ